MSDQSVEERLAAHGWSNKTQGGYPIEHFHKCKMGYFIGEADGEACVWHRNGDDSDKIPEFNLVPLPAPVATVEAPERMTDADCGILEVRIASILHGESGQPYPLSGANTERDSDNYAILYRERLSLARAVVRARREIAELNAEVERLARERDAAIELAARMRDSMLGPAGATPRRVKLADEFDQLYRKSLPAARDSVSCDHKWEYTAWHPLECTECCAVCGEVRKRKIACEHPTVGPDGTCHRCGTVTREFPFDRPTGGAGWFYRENSDSACIWQIGNRKLDEWVESIGGGWITLTLLRQCDRAPHPAGPWEPCVKGGA